MCPPTSTSDGNRPVVHSSSAVWAAAQVLKLDMKDVCCVCLEPIKTMAFKHTGVCGERHRKIRDNEPDRPQAIAGI